jgi:2',3'-cyclic-nucleotide 2'-phosphodiesterase (5'-nucleotidase family)
MRNYKTLILYFLIAFSFASCKQDKNTPSSDVKITILYTNDEHGWMEANDKTSGAAGMLSMWKSREEYNNKDKFLILSGGDMWTGPAISTWFKGQSMIEVMNEMGYEAAALGNHDFDFTVDTLYEHLKKMNFPVLSANIVEKASGNIPGFAKPYLILKKQGIKIGIIGLSSLSTPYTTFPAYVEDYKFTPYASAIEKYAPIVKEAGADIIIIAGHICENEMEILSATAKKFGIPLISGGHCHQTVLKSMNGVLLIESGAEMHNYVKVELIYNVENKRVTIGKKAIVPNQTSSTDKSVQSIVDYWQTKTEEALSEEIGYCSETIQESSVAMGNLVCDSWLQTFPNADVSITNSGGIRQNIEQGTISLETILGVLPFNNSIYELELSGTELLDCIDNYLVGGMTTIGGNRLSDGTPIYADSTYSVLTTDYLYSADPDFSKYDPTPNNTSENYRQPLIDWIKSMNTSSQDPLNNYLDHTARR